MTLNARFLYLSERHKEALNYLLSGLGQGGGFVLLTGEVGTGKTSVLRALFSQLDSNVHLALILNQMFSAQELLEAICDEFKISYTENAPLKQLKDSIVDFLKTEHERGFQTIIAIDEAQHLGADVLEQLRLLTNFETDTDTLLKVFLSGQTELQQRLQQANLCQLAQRITARYHLLPLTQKETESYIKHRLSLAEGQLSLFSASSIRMIVRRSKGIPRIVNLLCDKALWISYQKGTQKVDHQAVEEACKLVLDWQVETPGVAPMSTRVAPMAPPLWFPLLIAIGVSLLLTIGSYRFLPQYLESNYPIVKSVIEKPLEGFSSQSSAFQALLSVWGYSVNEFQANCPNAKRAQLYCVESNGTLADLLLLNRSALVWLQQPSGEELLAILYRVNSQGVELLLPSKRVKVSHQWFEQHWNGAYTQLWQKPIITERAMKLGDKGEAILALNRLLSFALEQPINNSDVFSKETELQVKEFQEIFGLETDGIVGSKTQMWLDSIVNVNAPVLQGGE